MRQLRVPAELGLRFLGICPLCRRGGDISPTMPWGRKRVLSPVAGCEFWQVECVGRKARQNTPKGGATICRNSEHCADVSALSRKPTPAGATIRRMTRGPEFGRNSNLPAFRRWAGAAGGPSSGGTRTCRRFAGRRYLNFSPFSAFSTRIRAGLNRSPCLADSASRSATTRSAPT